MGYGWQTNLPPPPSKAFDFNPKLEVDEDEDGMADLESVSPHHVTAPSLLTRQKSESDATPNNAALGVAPKRKRPLKLTASQRERKRAIDREAQRSIRTKTKNYITRLENLVKVMEDTDVTGQMARTAEPGS